jgi:hypothetical protein
MSGQSTIQKIDWSVMRILFLDEHAGFIPKLAAWCHEEWKDFYGGKTAEDVRSCFAANITVITFQSLASRWRRGGSAAR